MTNRSSDTRKSKKAVERTRTPRFRRRPIGAATAKLMSLCEAERVAQRMSYADVGRATGIKSSDISAALRLREEPTKRTVRELVAYFGFGKLGRAVSLKQREVALLIEMEAAFTRAADKIEAFLRLREGRK